MRYNLRGLREKRLGANKYKLIFECFIGGLINLVSFFLLTKKCQSITLGGLRSATRPAQRHGLNFSSRMSGKQFDCCNKYLTLFQITLQTATFG